MTETVSSERASPLLLLLALGLLVTVGVLVALGAMMRASSPGGSFLLQEHETQATSQAGLERFSATIQLGETSESAVRTELGQPEATVTVDGLTVLKYSQEVRLQKEVRLLGLVKVGSSSSTSTSVMGIGIRNGVVVATSDAPSPDPATRNFFAAGWEHLVAEEVKDIDDKIRRESPQENR